MVTTRTHTRSVADIAEAFVSTRRPGSVVSIEDAIEAIKYLATFCEHTDSELAEIVMLIAKNHGRSVAFDRIERRPIACAA
jgi:hypothetical protein